MPPLSERQIAVLDFICVYIEKHKFPPTVREVGNHIGVTSPKGIKYHMRALEKKGVIFRLQDLSRGIVVMI